MSRRPGLALVYSTNCVARLTNSVHFLLLAFIFNPATLPIATAQEAIPSHPTEAANRPPTNRLAKETSPYLLQHAHNPVQWYPWSEEALKKAVSEQKLIFLSIGYSSCHWCHVMERESFVDKEIADYLNENFVCIKVDREERPDVDAIYMMAVQVISRRGGWPLSVFLTPQAKPFFGGTYFPARDNDRPGTIGFLTVAKRVVQTWQTEKKDVVATGDQVATIIREQMAGPPAVNQISIDQKLLERCQQKLSSRFDSEWGGFGYTPSNPNINKFPEASNLMFLMTRAQRGDTSAAKMLRTTLDRMAMGGMWDHLGGGFHRYSTDRFWHIPHFEKMLYDNGQLASVYAQASAFFQDDNYAQIVEEIVAFLQREMTDPSGGFYSALDADSEGEEGAFYRWKQTELAATLGADGMVIFQRVFAETLKPNFEGEYFVPLRLKAWSALAQAEGRSVAELKTDLQPLKLQLLEVRSHRERPLTDTKILTAWNGLMIQGLADAGRILGKAEYVALAATAADFLLENSRDPSGRLRRSYSHGEPRLNAYLDDYAFLTAGVIALHKATKDNKWIEVAKELSAKQDELFWDEEQGGYFFTSKDHEKLIVRGKIFIDGARPSGNSVAAENLVYLAKILDDKSHRERALKTIQSATPLLDSDPSNAARMCHAVDLLLNQP